jgi:hypothetical protein
MGGRDTTSNIAVDEVPDVGVEVRLTAPPTPTLPPGAIDAATEKLEDSVVPATASRSASVSSIILSISNSSLANSRLLLLPRLH